MSIYENKQWYNIYYKTFYKFLIPLIIKKNLRILTVSKFSKKELLNVYAKMYTSRKLDDKQLILLKQGKGFFHIGASGHEAAGMAAAINFTPSKDFAYPYYRDQAYCIGIGMTSREILLSFLAIY